MLEKCLRGWRPRPALTRSPRQHCVICLQQQPPVAARVVILAFDQHNRLAVRQGGTSAHLPFLGSDLIAASGSLAEAFPEHTPPAEYYGVEAEGQGWQVYFTQVADRPAGSGLDFRTIESLAEPTGSRDPLLHAVLVGIEPHLIEVPYLHLGEADFIYKFRVERDRNRSIYQQDEAARSLYQSRLCDAIKLLARTNERNASRPAVLDFGVVRYVIPSHFGFCLGVKNAIERAYETLAENPGRRVFMLSELIHNSFVNDDLLRRGLRYLQTDKGRPYTVTGTTAVPGEKAQLLWESLGEDDVVIIPAFGATDEDKRRLVRKGIRVAQYDATCMLVEKVWKAARVFGRAGYSVVIHGKSEHEETKATFSNSRRHAPSIIIRNQEEARMLGEYIRQPSREARDRLLRHFQGVCTPGFDPELHLERLAVVNQTTLLMNETAGIISYFRGVFDERFGAGAAEERVGGGTGRADTLCYATQVNQDALSRALELPLDAAIVIGGRNSSNTYQLYRLCEARLGARALFIQSEGNIRSREEVEHYVFPSAKAGTAGRTEVRALPGTPGRPMTILLTGGASCPDGLIQQVITRINSLFPSGHLRDIELVLAELRSS